MLLEYKHHYYTHPQDAPPLINPEITPSILTLSDSEETS